MSTSGNVMRLAAEELEASDLVTVVDSANLSTGIGLLVIEAAIMAEKGQSAAEIAATIASLNPISAQALSSIHLLICTAVADATLFLPWQAEF